MKLDRGGIRDIEFLVQCLQRLHGGASPGCATAARCWRSSACRIKGFFSDAEYGRLASAYQFLRNLEHRLQLDDDRQTHTLPRTGGAGTAGAAMPGGGGSGRRGC